MMIFSAIAIASFILVAGAFLFGHDHDVGADHDLGHDADAGGDDATVSIFSTKVIGSVLMGFGAAGAIARFYGLSYMVSSLLGVVAGVLLAAVMYGVLSVFYKQQASSLVPSSSAVGRSGTVTVTIGEGAMGEIGLTLNGTYSTYSASAKDGQAIAKGQVVRVVKNLGSHLIVEKEA